MSGRDAEATVAGAAVRANQQTQRAADTEQYARGSRTSLPSLLLHSASAGAAFAILSMRRRLATRKRQNGATQG